ncbi:MAG: hypothetical protein ACRC1D_10240 [Culicoidibacterales bacterium]
MVPYASYAAGSMLARRAARYALMKGYGGRAGQAARLISGAWRRRKTIYKAAASLKRAGSYLRRPKKRRIESRLVRYKVQNRHGTSTGYSSNLITYGPQTLYVETIPFPSARNPAISEGERIGSRIFVHGIKICRTFNVVSEGFPIRYQLNWALVQAKEGVVNDAADVATIKAQIKEDFFRETGITGRVSQFEDSPALWNAKYNCAPMNPNSDYKIITRWKFDIEQLRPNVPTSHCIKKIDKYFRLKLPMEFEDNSFTQPKHAIYELFWFSAVLQKQHQAFAQITCNKNLQTYYSNKM